MFTDTTRTDPVGRCPECAATVSSADVLIEYETPAGERLYAECAHCSAVVHPE